MRKIFFLFFALFYYIVAAQSTPEEAIISNKLRHLAASNIDLKKKEAGLLQLKAESEKLGYDLGILISGDYLMLLYGENGRNQEIIALGEQLKKVAKGKKDTKGYIADIHRQNALALGYLGLNDASLKDLKKAINYTKDITDRNTRVYQLSICYQNMGLHYNLKRYEDKNLRDSLLYTYEKSLEFAKQIDDDSKAIHKETKYDHIAFIEMRLGIFYLEQGNINGSLELAEKHLMEGLKIHQDKKYNIPPDSKIMMLNQVSWLYMEKKEYEKSIDYAKQALELEKHFRQPYHRVESFEFLADCYREVNEKEKSKFYMEKYTFLKDSLTYVDRTNANITMKKLVAETDSEHRESSKKQWMITGALALLAGGSTLVVWRRRNKNIRKNYEKIIDRLKNETVKTKDKETVPLNKNQISDETEKELLAKLELFERSKGYIKKDITIGFLSVKFETNQRYLSEIIRKNRSHNFSNYINSLRIEDIIHKLYNEPKYREYKISYLAQQCGFSSAQVFVIAFKKMTGVTPSYFIHNLKNDEVA